MRIWIDAQLSPSIARWIRKEFQIEALAVRDLKLRNATDHEIFFAARREAAIVMTKDADFPQLLEAKGPPPKVIWLTCGNTFNTQLKRVPQHRFRKAINFLNSGENLVEISDQF